MKIAPARALAVLTSSLFCLSLDGRAADLFRSVFFVNGNSTASRGANSLLKVTDLFENWSLEEMFPDYVEDVSAVEALVDLRGVWASLSYPGGSTILRFRVPVLGIDISFEGTSRDEAQEQFENWITGKEEAMSSGGPAALTTLLQGLVKLSPVDPIAGNPYSLQNRMFTADFAMGTSGPLINSPWNMPPGIDGKGDWAISGRYAFNQAGTQEHQVNAVELRPSYNHRFQGSPRVGLVFDLPLTFTAAETGESYMASLGAGLQYRPFSWWSLTPALRFGAAGSIDVGGLAGMYSGTLTSYMRHNFGKVTLGWALTGGGMQSLDVFNFDYFNFNYELSNFPIRNRLEAGGELGFDLWGVPAHWQVTFADTWVLGSDVYLDHYNEVGIGLIRMRPKPAGTLRETIGLRLSYLFGEDYNGLSAVVNYEF